MPRARSACAAARHGPGERVNQRGADVARRLGAVRGLLIDLGGGLAVIDHHPHGDPHPARSPVRRAAVPDHHVVDDQDIAALHGHFDDVPFVQIEQPPEGVRRDRPAALVRDGPGEFGLGEQGGETAPRLRFEALRVEQEQLVEEHRLARYRMWQNRRPHRVRLQHLAGLPVKSHAAPAALPLHLARIVARVKALPRGIEIGMVVARVDERGLVQQPAQRFGQLAQHLAPVHQARSPALQGGLEAVEKQQQRPAVVAGAFVVDMDGEFERVLGRRVGLAARRGIAEVSILRVQLRAERLGEAKELPRVRDCRAPQQQGAVPVHQVANRGGVGRGPGRPVEGVAGGFEHQRERAGQADVRAEGRARRRAGV